MKLNLNIIFNIVIGICIIALITLLGFAFYDYNDAHTKCLDLKSEEDCGYEICMAKEYDSNDEIQKAVNCVFLYEHDAKGEKDE